LQSRSSKDLPDVEGDRRYAIATFSMRFGVRPVFALGLAALSMAELGMAVASLVLLHGTNRPILARAHLGAAAVLWAAAARVDLADGAMIMRVYMQVWMLFFLEYAIIAAGYLFG
jgi:homogentisate phytyltransferase/homogentisate geranylgeranyltransferase